MWNKYLINSGLRENAMWNGQNLAMKSNVLQAQSPDTIREIFPMQNHPKRQYNGWIVRNENMITFSIHENSYRNSRRYFAAGIYVFPIGNSELTKFNSSMYHDQI